MIKSIKPDKWSYHNHTKSALDNANGIIIIFSYNYQFIITVTNESSAL